MREFLLQSFESVFLSEGRGGGGGRGGRGGGGEG
jgi:hypothetical protein